MSPATWTSTGNEPWPFRVDVPDDLPGLHAEAMAAALGPGERYGTLAYLPIGFGHQAPFGSRGTPASHAVGVTDTRVVLSADRHAAGAPPIVESIALDGIVALEAGPALLLGWLVLWHVNGDGVRTATVLHGSTGSEPVVEIARRIRGLCASAGTDARAFARRPGRVAGTGGNPRLAGRVSALLPDESPVTVAVAGERWKTGRRRLGRACGTCVASSAVVGYGDLGWTIVRAEPRRDPSTCSFGVGLTAIPTRAVRAVRLAAVEDGTKTLEVVFGSQAAQAAVRVPVTAVGELLSSLLLRGAA